MFYTKYRPQKFSDISKPNDIADALAIQVKSEKTVHAYLFVGPRGTGKTTTARILAKALNCKKIQKNGDPCDKCENCLAVKNGSFLDLIEIDAASNRGIDDIRDLKEKINLSPTSGTKKVYIIDEVHMLTNEAFNALLKTLEEPPAHVVFLLCTTELHKVPDTIKSRCQVFKFKRASITQLTEKLKNIAISEKSSITEADIKKIAAVTHGGFRDAETLLQQVIEGEINVDSLLSSTGMKAISDFALLLVERNVDEAIKIVNDLYENGADLYVWSGEVVKFFRDVLLLQSGSTSSLSDYSEDLLSLIKELAKKSDVSKTVEILEIISRAQNDIKNSFIVQLPLELAIVKLSGNSVVRNPEMLKTAPIVPVKKVVTVDDSKKVEKTPLKEEEIVTPQEVETTSVENSIDFDEVKKNWRNLVKDVSKINSSVAALLRSADLKDILGAKIVLEVPFDFHKERLESSKNKDLIEKFIQQTYAMRLTIECVVKKKEKKKISENESGTLTDFNILVPANEVVVENPEAIMGMFDGALPL